MGPSASEMIDKEEAELVPLWASPADLDLSLWASGYRDRQWDEERAEVHQVRDGTWWDMFRFTHTKLIKFGGQFLRLYSTEALWEPTVALKIFGFIGFYCFIQQFEAHSQEVLETSKIHDSDWLLTMSTAWRLGLLCFAAQVKTQQDFSGTPGGGVRQSDFKAFQSCLAISVLLQCRPITNLSTSKACKALKAENETLKDACGNSVTPIQ